MSHLWEILTHAAGAILVGVFRIYAIRAAVRWLDSGMRRFRRRSQGRN